MLNKVMMIGRLTRDPEPRVTSGGTKVANFSLATNEIWYQDGEKKEKTAFSEWVIWNGSSENLCKIAGKGDLIYAEGKFNLEEWTDAEGNKRSKPRFTALTWQLLSKVATKGGDNSSSSEEDSKPTTKRNRPKKESSPSAQTTSTSSDEDDDSEEIPF